MHEFSARQLERILSLINSIQHSSVLIIIIVVIIVSVIIIVNIDIAIIIIVTNI